MIRGCLKSQINLATAQPRKESPIEKSVVAALRRCENIDLKYS